MAKNPKEEQMLQLIRQSSATLIALPEKPSTDAIASGLALLSVIEKLGKRAKVVSSGFTLPANHTFLPKSNEIYDDLSALRQFVISLDVSRTSVEELSYAIQNNQLNVYVTPKDGFFSEADVSTSSGEYMFDLIIVLDAQDIASLGRVSEMNTDFFYHVPVVNIDHNPANEHFGQLNIVNVAATSTSEIAFEIIKDWGEHILDEYIATNLLTGMISKTKSFQSGSVTPRSLAIASHLISQGARREDIVRHLYQSKKISTLKLWGRALSRLEADSEHKIVWSVLEPQDFAGTHARPEELSDVIDELIINTPEAQNVFMLYSDAEHRVQAVLSTAPYIHATELFADFTPQGSDHFISFSAIGTTTQAMKDMILSRLRTVLSSVAQRG